MSREADLIGYLLDVLEPDERRLVESGLSTDPSVDAGLQRLRRVLTVLEIDREPPAPPADLAARTLARVAALGCRPTATGPSEATGSATGAVPARSFAAPVPVTPSTAATGAVPARSEPGWLPTASPGVFPASVAAAAAASLAPLAPRPDSSRLGPFPPAPREAPEARLLGGRLRPDLLVAAGIALFACGLVFSGIGKLRAEQQLVSSQANLRSLHAGLTVYADTHGGRYPQVGLGGPPTAGSLASALWDAGQRPTSFTSCCPADLARPTGAVGSLGSPSSVGPPGSVGSPGAVGHIDTLGLRTSDGGLASLRRTSGFGLAHEHDLVPIAADLTPTAAVARATLGDGDGSVSQPPRGLNVLFAGGNVRFSTSVWLGGDDISRNVFGAVTAGLHRRDGVPDRPLDRP